jgi:hypothetical protein
MANRSGGEELIQQHIVDFMLTGIEFDLYLSAKRLCFFPTLSISIDKSHQRQPKICALIPPAL